MSGKDTKNLAVLEQLLSDVRDCATSEQPAIAEAISEAMKICQRRYTVYGGLSFQLQCALASIRTGRPEDAAQYIENARTIEANWTGMLP
jgi:hypothetical protein